jgi:hypothetical protein
MLSDLGITRGEIERTARRSRASIGTHDAIPLPDQLTDRQGNTRF